MEIYTPRGVCSRQIVFEVEDGKLGDVRFIGGCSGNLQGIAKLVKGMKLEDVVTKLKGIQCRNNTSCPDQFAKALTEYLEKNK